MALHIINDIFAIGRQLQPLCKQIGRYDKELASQIRRAWVRTGMNAGEAQHRRGAKACNRFDDAMGEAREAHTGLRMALAFDFVDSARAEPLLDPMDKVVATLYKLSNKPR